MPNFLFKICVIGLLVVPYNIFAQWIQVQKSAVNCLLVDSSTVFASNDSIGIMRSFDNGATWTAGDSSLRWTAIYCMIFKGAILYMGGGGVINIRSSVDSGNSWKQVASFSNSLGIFSFAVTGDHIFAGGYYGKVYVSSNDGASWADVSPSWRELGDVHALAVNGSYLFVGNSLSKEIYATSDNGQNWKEIDSGLYSGSSVLCFAFNGSTLYTGTADGVYRFNKTTSVWTLLNTDLVFPYGPNIPIGVNSLVLNGPDIFAGTDSIYLSKDSGSSWISVSSGLPPIVGSGVYSLAAGNGYLFTDLGPRGIWRRPLSEMLANKNVDKQRMDSKVARIHVINKNRIQYDFSGSAALVTIKLYDIYGRLIKTLLNCVQQPGSYTASMPRGISQGRYILSFVVGSKNVESPISILK